MKYDHHAFSPKEWAELLDERHLLNNAIAKKIYGKLKIDKGNFFKERFDTEASQSVKKPMSESEYHERDIG
jgi:hypothetical protein